MSTDYRDAAERHFEDAEFLRSDSASNRDPNADHLYGFSAECSLKAVMTALGMERTNAGAPRDSGLKVHMPEQWVAFQSFASGRLAARYLDKLDQSNPFSDWKVDQRYVHRVQISATVVNKHREAAIHCRTCLHALILDGVEAPQ
jgi:hypothetical protein